MPALKWIDTEYYTDTYGGQPVEQDKFPVIAAAAERQIDKMTHFNLSKLDFPNSPVFIQDHVKMAICAQIEYFYEMGAWTETGMQTVQSASLGGFHYQLPTTDQSASNLMRSDVAVSYLQPTGLMYAGLRVKNAGWDGQYGYWGAWDFY